MIETPVPAPGRTPTVTVDGASRETVFLRSAHEASGVPVLRARIEGGLGAYVAARLMKPVIEGQHGSRQSNRSDKARRHRSQQ